MNSKRTARNQQIADLVFAGIISAIIIIMIFVPQFGFITLSATTSVTIVHIPVLAGTIVLGRRYGILFGTIFGLGAMIMSFSSLPTDAPFTNPLLSVLPRIIFGYLIVFIYDGFNKFIKNRYVSIPLTMGVATLVHSLMVIPILYLFVKADFYFFVNSYIYREDIVGEQFFLFIYGLFIANSIFEIILAILIGTAVTIPLLIIKENYR